MNMQSNMGNSSLSSWHWSVVFEYTCWNIWLCRCAFVHNNVTWPLQAIMDRVSASLNEHRAFIDSSRKLCSRHYEFTSVSWIRPPSGQYKINTDGSVLSSGSAACGGVIRDDNGSWIMSFLCPLGLCSINIAELRGILLAIEIARRLNLNHVHVETESVFARDAIINGVGLAHPQTILVARIKKFILDNSWSCSVNHVYREANSVADHLANLSHSLSPGVHEFHDVVDSCRDKFEADFHGTAYSRLVTLS